MNVSYTCCTKPYVATFHSVLKIKKMSHLSKSSEVKYFYNDFGDRTITGLLTTGLLTTEHMTTDLLTSQVF